MKNNILLLLALCSIAIHVNAQQYKINYVQSSKRGGGRQQVTIGGVDQEQVNKLLNSVRKTYYELHINGHESFYKESDRADGNESANGLSMFAVGGNAEIYINHNAATKTEKVELNETDYIITDSLKNMPWQITNDERTILGVLCKKAIIKVKSIQRKQVFISSTQSNSQVQADTTIKNDSTEIVAWYAPSINVSAAPNTTQIQLAGTLPGCVLAVYFGGEDNDNNIIATDITNKVQEKLVKQPTKGKKITREAYQKKREELFNQMRENMRNGGGRFMGAGMQ
jgi:GLPGLI family protein